MVYNIGEHAAHTNLLDCKLVCLKNEGMSLEGVVIG